MSKKERKKVQSEYGIIPNTPDVLTGIPIGLVIGGVLFGLGMISDCLGPPDAQTVDRVTEFCDECVEDIRNDTPMSRQTFGLCLQCNKVKVGIEQAEEEMLKETVQEWEDYFAQKEEPITEEEEEEWPPRVVKLANCVRACNDARDWDTTKKAHEDCKAQCQAAHGEKDASSSEDVTASDVPPWVEEPPLATDTLEWCLQSCKDDKKHFDATPGMYKACKKKCQTTYPAKVKAE